MLAKLKEQVQGLLVEEGSTLRIASLAVNIGEGECRGLGYIFIGCNAT